ncbi:MAG: glycosyltransferase family 2 protein [Bacteroidetes bacterium]|nr:glycosyltransferase family 2 protein [Bacteroidota bacterium]
MNQLSVVIITYNEEDTIARCIDSVRAIADEIIVLDSFSTDKTVAIAKEKGAKIIKEKFQGFTAQKNLVISYSSSQYVFSIDADEVVSEELLRSIQIEKQKDFPADAYEMNRLNFFGTRAIKTCGCYPDTKVRLWNKDLAGWKGGLVHEAWSFLDSKKDGVIEKLNGDLLHYTYQTNEDLVCQSDRFAALAAKTLKEKNIFYLLAKMLFSALFKFIRNYFFKLGFTEGALGFTICYYQSSEVFLKYYYALKLKYA